MGGFTLDFARKLERERDIWIAEAERWRKNTDLYHTVLGQRDRLMEEIENLKASGIHTCHDQCKRPMCVMRRERDRLAEELDTLKQSILDLSHPNMKLLLEERKGAIAIAQKLAGELKEAQDAIEMMLRDSSCRRIPAYTEEQLAAMKGGSDE
jgi:hypothetical protein